MVEKFPRPSVRGCAARIGVGACGELGIADYGGCGDDSVVDCDCAGLVVFGEGVAEGEAQAGGGGGVEAAGGVKMGIGSVWRRGGELALIQA